VDLFLFAKNYKFLKDINKEKVLSKKINKEKKVEFFSLFLARN
jgi:hypothetical protein